MEHTITYKKNLQTTEHTLAQKIPNTQQKLGLMATSGKGYNVKDPPLSQAYRAYASTHIFNRPINTRWIILLVFDRPTLLSKNFFLIPILGWEPRSTFIFFF